MLAILLLFSSLASGQEPSLLQRANFLMEVPPWREIQWTVGEYAWWSPTRIVGFAEDPQSQFRPTIKHVYDLSGEKADDAVPPAFEASTNLSPDRKSFVSEEWKGENITWTVKDLSTQKVRDQWTMQSRTSEPLMDQDNGYFPPSVQWSQDGKCLYQIQYWPQDDGGLSAEIVERPLGHARYGRTFPTVSGLSDYTQIYVVGGRAIAPCVDFVPSLSYLEMKEWKLDDPAKSMRTWKIAVPNDGRFLSYQPSPDFKHALWLVAKGPHMDDEMGGLPFEKCSLWVSGLRGENMRELGVLLLDANKPDWQNFGGIVWNPDSQHVSFIFRRKLYWIDA